MLNVLGGFEKLASAIGKAAAPTASAGSAPPAGRAGDAPARDTDATLQAGMPSAMGLEPAVTLEGIASTLSRIYSARPA